MTRSGERNALEPDLVPVHQRVRDLCGHFPEGRLPGAEVKALRESIERSRPGSRALLPQRRTKTRAEFEAFKRDRQVALGVLADMLRSAAAGTDADLQRLSERLRDFHDHQHLRFDPESLGLDLPPERLRAIALHLLRTGTTGTEMMTGLQLMTVAADTADAELLGDLAPLGRAYAAIVSKALPRVKYPVPQRFALAKRDPEAKGSEFTAALAEAPRAEIDALVATLSVADAIALLRMTVDLQGVPKWLKGNVRLAEAVAAAAENPLLLEDGTETPFSMVWLRDEIRYGKCAFLGFSASQREQAIARLGAWLSSPHALRAVESAVARRPHDSRAIWLRRQVMDAQRDPTGDVPAGLAIRVVAPQPGTDGDVRTHLLIDGMPLIPRVFVLGGPAAPEWVLHSGEGLRATGAPREVELAQADCSEVCCGTMRAEIRRDDDAAGRVEWEIWLTRQAHEHRERFSFDAAAYDAEVARATGDVSWEWPARRAARILGQRLRVEPGLMSRWGCRPGWAGSWNRERSLLRLHFLYGEGEPFATDLPWLQFEYQAEVPDSSVVDDDAIDAAVDRIVKQFTETDPKTLSRVCGGSRASAEALGFAWPHG
jgi:hypothetical protein